MKTFPIRFKILIALLILITTVVSIITFTMANLFHTDKTAYIHDLTSVIALHTSQEATSLLSGYGERLQVFTRLMYDQEMSQQHKASLLKKLFEDFQEFISVTLYEEGAEPVTLYDATTLEATGLNKEDLFHYREQNPLPMDRIEAGSIFIENSTFSDRLPCLTLAMVQKNTDNDRPAVVSAVIRLESLLGLAKRSDVFEIFLLDAGGTLLAHTDPIRVAQHTRMDWLPQLKRLQEQQSLGTTLEYAQDGSEWIGGFARVEFGGLLAGVQVPKTAAYLTARGLLKNLMGVSLALLIMSALLGLFWSRSVTRPIEQLSKASKFVGKGEFDITVQRTSRDEIGDLAESFNEMAAELNTREKALKDAQAALVQSEKMAAFGQLGAGIAHEVKNPLAGILGFAQLSLRKVEEDSQIHRNLMIIQKETRRCKTIIENLLKFARQEKVSRNPTEINPVVEDSINIVDHQLGINQVRLVKDLSSGLPPFLGNANQIQQVLMNLMMNAQQAMEGKPGVITITTRRLEPGEIEVRVRDDGPGIPEEIQDKLFEPFFTTKATGKGTGLGLSVSYGIIKDHNGDIRVESKPGMGAAFIIILPINTDEADERPEQSGIPEQEPKFPGIDS